MNLSEILNYIFGGTTITTLFLGWRARKYELSKIKSSASQEKISTADKTIELLDKLTVRMDSEFDRMKLEIADLNVKYKKTTEELNQYINQCSKCSNNKLRK